MATIVPSELAPSEQVHYLLGGAEFDLGGAGKGSKKSYETTDPTILASATAHPWLDVKTDPAQEVDFSSFSTQVRPEDDQFSAAWSGVAAAYDSEAIRKAEEERTDAVVTHTALNANLDQDEVITTGTVAETVAADNKQKDND